MLILDEHDQALVEVARASIKKAMTDAHMPVAVVKRIVSIAVNHRNAGRAAAITRHPFKGVCEASGLPLDRNHAHLDEMEPELGYEGKVRWVCPRANNSGKHSCGGC